MLRKFSVRFGSEESSQPISNVNVFLKSRFYHTRNMHGCSILFKLAILSMVQREIRYTVLYRIKVVEKVLAATRRHNTFFEIINSGSNHYKTSIVLMSEQNLFFFLKNVSTELQGIWPVHINLFAK